MKVLIGNAGTKIIFLLTDWVGGGGGN
jgi:hypothetical protein